MSTFCRTLSLLALLAVPAAAERNDPGSLLIFPEYDSRPGSITFVTVTNTSSDAIDGSIRVHFNYVDAETCLKSDAMETLTPRDTITVTTMAHAPGHSRGYCFAYARALTSSQAVTFNHLVGQVLVLDGAHASEYSMNALVFEGKTAPGTSTDLDFDGLRDLDGLEYGATPDKIVIPRFFGQVPPSGGGDYMRAELVLLGLTGTRFTTTINFLIYNDNEEGFSSQFSFDCWDRVPLRQISGAFDNAFLSLATNNDPTEILGLPGWESGWFEMDGGAASSSTTTVLDPAFLAVLVEAQRLSSASLPFTLGSQTNGALLSQSLSGH
ncbi:MAG: hypothetical protein H6828_14915 [Planctomycetes bacterium]|nr:hypothetical protein [Planctomycetota bacterium]